MCVYAELTFDTSHADQRAHEAPEEFIFECLDTIPLLEKAGKYTEARNLEQAADTAFCWYTGFVPARRKRKTV